MTNAFVVTYYGGDGALIETLVLGSSLKKSGTLHDRLVFVRRGVDAWRVKLLESYFKVIVIDPFPVSGLEFAPESLSRFHGVFDKLYAWGLTDYDKVVLLDADMLVFQNADCLFELPTPAACFFGPPFGWQWGESLSSFAIRDGLKRSPGFLNIGLVVLTPSERTLAELDFALQGVVKAGVTYEFPEQDFLREFFINRWHTVPMFFNFRPINYAWGIPNRFWGRAGKDWAISDHFIFHYNWMYKPLQFLFHRETTRRVMSVGSLGVGLQNFFEALDRGIALPRFREGVSCRFSAVMNEWLIEYQEVIVGISDEVFTKLQPEPFMSLEECERFIKSQESEQSKLRQIKMQRNKRPVVAKIKNEKVGQARHLKF